MTAKRSRAAARKSARRYPFLVAHPVRLSEHIHNLREIERTNWYTNFGPQVERFTQQFLDDLFEGEGACTAVANATLGLILSVRASMLRAFGTRELKQRKIGIVPSFTFPATAQALTWNGLEIAFCDIDPQTWLPSHDSISRLVRKFGSRVGAIVPYATFGNNLDLTRYEDLSRRYAIPVVVDAAASVGSHLENGDHFGRHSKIPIVFSMHATKLLATSEGGIVYSTDKRFVNDVRSMSNFGFDENRVVTLPGLNAKLPEVAALQARLKLAEVTKIVRHRRTLVNRYKRGLNDFQFQEAVGRPAHPFLAARFPGSREDRDGLIAKAGRDGVELRKYYNPPLHRQSVFAPVAADVPNTDRVADEIIALPLHNALTTSDVDYISAIVRNAAKLLKR